MGSQVNRNPTASLYGAMPRLQAPVRPAPINPNISTLRGGPAPANPENLLSILLANPAVPTPNPNILSSAPIEKSQSMNPSPDTAPKPNPTMLNPTVSPNQTQLEQQRRKTGMF